MDSPEKDPTSPNGDQLQLYPLITGNDTPEVTDPIYKGTKGKLKLNKSTRVKMGDSDDDETVSLVHGRFEKIPFKDFGAEIRAFRDVENFMEKTLLMLEIQETDLQEIIRSMFEKILASKDREDFSVHEAVDATFTHDSVHALSRTIQGTISSDSGFDFDQSWICAMCELPTVSRRHVVIGRLKQPANLGSTSQEVQFIILVLAPTKEKHTKTAVETGRTFSTLFADLEFRYHLNAAPNEAEFMKILRERTRMLTREQSNPENRTSHLLLTESVFDNEDKESSCPFARGMIQDVKRRLPHYWSDFKDGIIGNKTPQKVTSTILFLYFACVLPNIAFGMLNDNNTKGVIGVKKILFSQCVGGILFAVFGGQPLIVLLTTAPLALYTKIIFSISQDFDLNFNAMFACTGLWNCFFLIIYSVTNLSKLMKFSTRSTEEIFSLFITFAFSADAIRDTIKDFNENYYTPACSSNVLTNSSQDVNSGTTNQSDSLTNTITPCLKENSILFLLLMLGTVWVGITLYNFTKTPFLTAGKRELLADYALPAAVLIMSFFGSYILRGVKLKPFKYDPDVKMFEVAPIHLLPWPAILAAAGLGFSLSLLFFMDQNISSALVNTPSNKLKKGAAYHWDLFTVAIINTFLSIFTLPWVHAALPHSPLHVKALADLEDRVDQGHVHQIVVKVRETRLTGIISHILIGLSMLLLPYPLSYIPAPVLDGLFLYVAITALFGNQLFDRILLFFTEQAAYPPNHYIRRVPQQQVHIFTAIQLVQLLVLCCFGFIDLGAAYPPNHYIRRVPQRQVHIFTAIQLVQLLVLCCFGFSPIAYMKMVFPILIMFLMPIRHKLVPKVIETKYLKALDGH